MKPQSFAAQGVFEKYGRKSRRELFLDEMEQIVPWSALESLVRPPYAKAGKRRQPVGLSMRVFGFDKMRYSGIAKNHQRLCANFAPVNSVP